MDSKTMYYLQDIQLHSLEEARNDFENVLSDMDSENRQFYFLHIRSSKKIIGVCIHRK